MPATLLKTDFDGPIDSDRGYFIATGGPPSADLPISPTGIQFISGRYYPCAFGLNANTAYGVGNMRLTPYFIGKTQRFVSASCFVVTANDASQTFRMGIYQDSGSVGGPYPIPGYPAQLIADFGQVSCATGGVKEVAIDITLKPGLYWLAGVMQGSGTAPILTGINYMLTCMPAQTTGGYNNSSGYNQGSVPAGPLPQFTSGIVFGAGAAVIWLKAA